jgi:hypothetical protein
LLLVVAVVVQVQEQQIADLALVLAVYLPQLQHLIPTQLIQLLLVLAVLEQLREQQAMALKDQVHCLAQ